jgi:hypothetical protein
MPIGSQIAQSEMAARGRSKTANVSRASCDDAQREAASGPVSVGATPE